MIGLTETDRRHDDMGPGGLCRFCGQLHTVTVSKGKPCARCWEWTAPWNDLCGKCAEAVLDVEMENVAAEPREPEATP